MTSKIYLFISIGVIQILLASCSSQVTHLEQDADKSLKTHQLFLKQKQLAHNRADELFSVFDKDITEHEREALEFLYAYMPLSDLANYDQDFFLKQVQYAFKARETFSWGATVPNDLFLHFVLPYRINNEDMDSARMVFYRELKERVQNLSMYDAALEVNHWCHEKVSYQPTDIRTSGPLSAIRSAFGRCGEESTFTVTAMRAVGIPARQIYTPRWAHSDDNHAWVEVWVDGEWYFLGACEPQPELNMGWFAGPATRAMLLHTRVFGDYTTTDDVVSQNNKYTELNVIPDYAPAKRLFVKIEDKDGKPVPEARVEFQLYNYAEFYPLSTTHTNENGLCSLLTGYGDLLIWASHGDQVAWKKATIANQDTLVLSLDNNANVFQESEFALVPPAVGKIAEASEEGIEENTFRLHQEDSIRSAYESTFIQSDEMVKVAQDLQLDEQKVTEIFLQSKGNWSVIKDFLYEFAPKDKNKALALLSVIADKDRRDVKYPVLVDHFTNSTNIKKLNTKVFTKYVLNPRIKNELLTPYKDDIQSYFDESFIQIVNQDINVLLNWIKDSITVVDNENTSRNPMWPTGVLKLKVADKVSRDMFLVAAMRSFGIPSRLEEARKIPQMWKNGEWIDLSFETINLEQQPKGFINISWTPRFKGDRQPQYYLQFTIAKFNGETFKTLDYEFSDVFESYPAKLKVEAGQYMMVTGVRESSGTVWVKRTFFEVKENQIVNVPIEFATPKTDLENKRAEVNLGHEFISMEAEKPLKLSDLDQGEGTVLVWIDPDREPTKHLINDLIRLKESFQNWNGSVALMVEPHKLTPGFSLDKYHELPDNVVFLKDTKSVRPDFLEEANCTDFTEYPMVFVLNHKGEAVYYSSGYKIGAGDEILSYLNTFCRIH